MDLGADDVIQSWDKASTVYSADSDDERIQKGKGEATEFLISVWFTETTRTLFDFYLLAKPGTRVFDEEGNEYEVFVDPITGKKYKK